MRRLRVNAIYRLPCNVFKRMLQLYVNLERLSDYEADFLMFSGFYVKP